MPVHKPTTYKFTNEPGTRTIAPLTYEDLGQFDSLSLINTLREPLPKKSKND